LISWLFSPDFLILVTVTLVGFLVFLFFRFSSSKRLRKDDPDFLLRDISKNLSSNNSVEMISGNKTTFISLDKNETNKLIEKPTSALPTFEVENPKQLIMSKIYNFLKSLFLKERKSISEMEGELTEKIGIEREESISEMEDELAEKIGIEREESISEMEGELAEKIGIEREESINTEKTFEDLSQIELPFFPEESKNLRKADDSPMNDELIKNEVVSKKDIQLDNGDGKTFFSFSKKSSEVSEVEEPNDDEKIIKDKLENSDEIFDVLIENIEDANDNIGEIERKREKLEIDFSNEYEMNDDKDSSNEDHKLDPISELDISVNEELITSKVKFDDTDEIRNFLEKICEDLYLSVEKPSKQLSEKELSFLQKIEERIIEFTQDTEKISSDIALRYAIICMYREKYNKATTILKETLLQTEQLGFVLNALAVASFARNNLESSITYSLEALRECGDDTILKEIVSSNLGYFYLQKGELNKALKSYMEILDNVDSSIETSLLPNLHLRVGKILNSIGDKDGARYHLTESIQLSQGKGKELIRIQSLIALASSQTKSGSIESSLKSLEEALRISQLIRNKEQEALVQGHIGLAFTAKDQFSKALLYHKKALEIYEEICNAKGQASNLASISNIYYFQDNLDEAQHFCEKAIEVSRESNNLLGIAQNSTNLGRIFFEKNEWVSSCNKLSEAREIYGELGDIVKVHEIEGILKIAKSNEKKEEVF